MGEPINYEAGLAYIQAKIARLLAELRPVCAEYLDKALRNLTYDFVYTFGLAMLCHAPMMWYRPVQRGEKSDCITTLLG